MAACASSVPAARVLPAEPAGRSDSPTTRPSQTHGGRTRAFEWSVNGDTLKIESESGVSHTYSFEEILAVLRLLHAQFRSNWFPLANNVEKLHHGTERYGLGGAIHQQKPGDTLHAQGASYLGVVLEVVGIFEWNGRKHKIEWRIRQLPDDVKTLQNLIARACDCS